MDDYFGPAGLLSSKVQGFEHRPQQAEMAEAVVRCFQLERPLLVEAGTGTGKTWAYLIPAILSGKKVVVSTGTKTLQDQILDHDIPFLKKLVRPGLKSVCLKGRKNYLCLRRFREFSYQPTFGKKVEAILYKRLVKWAERTKTGDRAEIAWLPDNFQAWNDVSSSSDECLGSACPDSDRCHLTRLRIQAQGADLLVVNHHLLLADLSLRQRGFTEIIPDHQAVIFDEAHQVEDVVSQFFGIHLGSHRLNELSRDLLKVCRKSPGKGAGLQGMTAQAEHLEVMSRLLHRSLQQVRKSPGRFRFDFDEAGPGRDFAEQSGRLLHALEQLRASVGCLADGDPVFESFERRLGEADASVRELQSRDDPSRVYWYEISDQGFTLHGTPVDVAPIFRERLLKRVPTAVFTSATLTVAGSFDFLKNGLGIDGEVEELRLSSPFDYRNQALLYIPGRFPLPHEPGFAAALAEEGLDILNSSRGRALFLFTSYRNMNEVEKAIRDRLPYPLLVQGQKPKRALLTEFVEQVDSVLLATSSFWQGVDVPGEALSCLLIDKLPFEVPDDPVIAARMERIEREGGRAFFQYQVPRAVIQLKQGIGRLIRSTRDRGVVAIFDRRLTTKQYGAYFLRSLSEWPVVHRMEQVRAFFEAQPDGGTEREGGSKRQENG